MGGQTNIHGSNRDGLSRGGLVSCRHLGNVANRAMLCGIESKQPLSMRVEIPDCSQADKGKRGRFVACCERHRYRSPQPEPSELRQWCYIDMAVGLQHAYACASHKRSSGLRARKSPRNRLHKPKPISQNALLVVTHRRVRGQVT